MKKNQDTFIVVYGGVFRDGREHNNIQYSGNVFVLGRGNPEQKPPRPTRKETAGKKAFPSSKKVKRGSGIGLWIRVRFDFDAKEAGEVSVRKGECAVVIREIEEWWFASLDDGRTGWLPKSFCEEI